MNPTIERYINKLLEQSTPERPIWNQEVMRKGGVAHWNYVDGCMIKALLDMYSLTGDKRFADFCDSFIDFHVQDDGSIRDYSMTRYNIDDINAGKTLFELYDYTGKEKYRKAIDMIYTHVRRQPRTIEGSFWHKLIYPGQIWLDGLYMGQPFYVEYETRYNNCEFYSDTVNQFQNVYEYLRDAETGLYYHAYDSSKTAFWCDKTTGLSQHFWLRSIGWFTMALLDCYEKMDEKYIEYREIIVEIFRDLIRSMLSFQDVSGMWYQIPNLGGKEKNYLETSGTAIMAYAILKGIRLGILPESYRKNGERAFNGICETYLTEVDGDLNLGGICLVAGLGGAGGTRRDGTYEYYMSEPIVENDAKGVAPFLLAYIELLRKEREEK